MILEAAAAAVLTREERVVVVAAVEATAVAGAEGVDNTICRFYSYFTF